MNLRVTQVRMLDSTLHVFTDNQRTSTSILIPPLNQGLIVSSFVTYFPIDLGSTIVKPTIIDPEQHISIEVVVVLQAISIAANGRILFIPIDTEW